MSSPNKRLDRTEPGILVRGKLISREKKQVGEAKQEVVTYGIMLQDNIIHVDEWRPETYLEVGDDVELRIRPRVYVSRTGRACLAFEKEGQRPGSF